MLANTGIKYSSNDDIEHEEYAVNDIPSENLSRFFDRGADFINKCR
jgi:hypothetical protein